MVSSARCYMPAVHDTPYAVQDTMRWWCMVQGARCEVCGVAGSSTLTVTVTGTLQSEAGVV